MVYVLLAEGFEEIEALTTVDILRRANLEVEMVGVTGDTITGSHNISIKSDVALEDISNIYDAIVLPGGMPGTKKLKKSSLVCQLIQNAVKQRKIVAAICAAPSILGEMQLLKNKCAVCYPGFESTLIESKVKNQLVVQDDIFITGKGPGATIPFALKIVENLTSKQVANSIYASMQCE